MIEFNEVHSAVRESDDQGAMELFRNPTYRGVVFRYNYYHNIGKPGTGHEVHGQAGIRLDDAISGLLVYSNVFCRSASGHFGAIQLNSGRDNIIDNNVFVDCKQGISGGWRSGNKVWRMLHEGNWPGNFHHGKLFLERYPGITTMLDKSAYNHVWRNVFYRCGPIVTGNRRHLDLLGNGIFPEKNPGFLDPENGDVRLRPNAPLFHKVGLNPIPVQEIGLYRHPLRASWPVHTAPASVRDWRKQQPTATETP